MDCPDDEEEDRDDDPEDEDDDDPDPESDPDEEDDDEGVACFFLASSLNLLLSSSFVRAIDNSEPQQKNHLALTSCWLLKQHFSSCFQIQMCRPHCTKEWYQMPN